MAGGAIYRMMCIHVGLTWVDIGVHKYTDAHADTDTTDGWYANDNRILTHT